MGDFILLKPFYTIEGRIYLKFVNVGFQFVSYLATLYQLQNRLASNDEFVFI